VSIEIYNPIMTIKDSLHKKIYLVQSELDHLFYIQRMLDDYDIHVYQTLKDLSSLSIPCIYEIMEIDQHLIIIEEYINMPTLESWISNHELTHEHVSLIIEQLCQTLRVLHQHHIVHRDIKPENIFFDGKKVYLFDFDISRIHQQHQIKDTKLLGSYGYAAPEQFGFAQSDERTDIYALGILWNVMLTGQFPQVHLYEGKEKVIIEKAIELDPKQRYQTIQELQNNWMKKSIDSWALPGYRHSHLSKKIIATLLYILLAMVVLYCEFENIPRGSMLDFFYRIMVAGFIMIIVLFAGNYRYIYHQCLFFHSQYQLMRFLGIVITCILVLFAWVFFFAFVLGIIGLI